MEETQKAFVVSIRFSKVGKLYHFDASHIQDVLVDDRVVVETTRGMQLGTVAQIIGWTTPQEDGMSWKPVNRKATPADLLKRKGLESSEEDLLKICRKAVFERDLSGVKIVSVEYSLDGIRLSILYSVEGEQKIDLRFLKQEVNRINRNAQVELRQIGPRDVAKIIAGMGACGLPTRCCSKFLTDFSSISIKMAKEQGISLTPAEITGMCGRLRCCLIYEYSQYHENRKNLPKRNKMIVTPVGEGKVVDILPLKMAAIVDIPEVGRREFSHSDLMTREQFEAQKAEKIAQDESSKDAVKTPQEETKQDGQSKEDQNNQNDQKPRGQRRHRRYDEKRGKGRKGYKGKDSQRDQKSGDGQNNQNQNRRRKPNDNRNKPEGK